MIMLLVSGIIGIIMGWIIGIPLTYGLGIALSTITSYFMLCEVVDCIKLKTFPKEAGFWIYVCSLLVGMVLLIAGLRYGSVWCIAIGAIFYVIAFIIYAIKYHRSEKIENAETDTTDNA